MRQSFLVAPRQPKRTSPPRSCRKWRAAFTPTTNASPTQRRSPCLGSRRAIQPTAKAWPNWPTLQPQTAPVPAAKRTIQPAEPEFRTKFECQALGNSGVLGVRKGDGRRLVDVVAHGGRRQVFVACDNRLSDGDMVQCAGPQLVLAHRQVNLRNRKGQLDAPADRLEVPVSRQFDDRRMKSLVLFEIVRRRRACLKRSRRG